MKLNHSCCFWAIAVAVSSLLVACGGGGGGNVATTPSAIKGAVIDGYLKGAVVCLDINANLKCDGASEYQTTSGDNGAYTLTLADGVDVSKYHVLAEVGTNAIDSDTNAAPAKAYSLLAPAVDAAVVTPLTTFVSNTLLTNSNMTLDEAKAQTLTVLNLPSSTKLNQDYVMNKDESSHRVAIMAAAVLGQVKTDVLTAMGTAITEAQKTEAFKQTMKQAQTTVATYSKAASSATDATALNTVKTSATGKAAADVAANTTLKDTIQQQAELGSTKVTALADWAKSGGIFDIQLNNTYDATKHATQEGVSYSRTSSTDGTKVTSEKYFTPKVNPAWVLNGGWSWVKAEDSLIYSASVSQNSWVDTTDIGTFTWAASGDGNTGILTSDKTGESIKFSSTVLDVSSKKASAVPHLLSNADTYCWDATTSQSKACADWTDFTFSAGAQIIYGTSYRNQDHYYVSGCAGCGAFPTFDSSGNGKVSYTDKTLDAVIAKANASNPLYLGAGVATVFTKVSDTSGVVSFRGSNVSIEVGKGVYEITTVAGKKVMTITVTDENSPGTLIKSPGSKNSAYYFVHYTNTRVILVEWTDKVLMGTVYLKGLINNTTERPSLNRIAANDLLKAQGYIATK